MVNRDNYQVYCAKKIHGVSKNRNGVSTSMGITIPKPLIRLMGLAARDYVCISMAKDSSHIIIEPADMEKIVS